MKVFVTIYHTRNQIKIMNTYQNIVTMIVVMLYTANVCLYLKTNTVESLISQLNDEKKEELIFHRY